MAAGVMVALEARYPCQVCGYRLRLLMTATARINKRSLRMQALIGVGPGPCPECRTVTVPPLYPVYQLTPAAAVTVAAYRAHRWPEPAQETL